MAPELSLPLLTFAAISVVTPGPNNIMLMQSGARFGLRQSLPHMLGITGGIMAMVAAVGLGLSELFARAPALRTGLSLLCGSYLLLMAWTLVTSTATQDLQNDAATTRPMSFFEAALFQWINPKAWAMSIAAVTLFAPAQSLTATITVMLAFAIVTMPSASAWTLAGHELRRFLDTPRRTRAFNLVMGALLALSVLPMIG